MYESQSEIICSLKPHAFVQCNAHVYTHLWIYAYTLAACTRNTFEIPSSKRCSLSLQASAVVISHKSSLKVAILESLALTAVPVYQQSHRRSYQGKNHNNRNNNRSRVMPMTGAVLS